MSLLLRGAIADPVASGSVVTPLALCAAAGILALLLGPRGPNTLPAAAAAGLGAGVLVGIALALRAPAYWVSPDTAWHIAKVAVAADGHPLQDPILRVRTIYPFLYHWLLAWPVTIGVPLRSVMTGISALALAGTCSSFWWAARARLEPVPAAWTALALPLFFHAPHRGYVLLPDPSNLSWVPLLVGVGLLLRAERTPDRWRAAVAGALLGLAGLIWYGHLPHLVLLALLLVVSSRPLGLRVIAGAALPALLLIVHLVSLSHGLGGTILGGVEDTMPDRLGAMLCNLLGLSGATPWTEAPVWIGVIGIVLLVLRWRRPPPQGPGRVLPRLAIAVGVSLLGSGLLLRYWEPFSWRYGLVLWATLLLIAAELRPWRIAGRVVSPLAVPALLTLVVLPLWWLPVIRDSARLASRHAEDGAAVTAHLEEHTAPDEPVFATVATWEHIIGCCSPRPNLVDRDGGIYKYAPSEIVEPRYADYLGVVSASSPEQARGLLEPYGFRLAVIHVQDLQRPGLAALAAGFEPRLVTEDYLVVDLHAPVP